MPFTQYMDATDTQSGPSPIIWSDCPVLEMLADPSKGVHFFDDFYNFAPLPTTITVTGTATGGGDPTDHDHAAYVDAGAQGMYDNYNDAGVTIKSLAGVVNGQVQVAGNDADNDEGILATYSPFVQVSNATPRKLWFEARIKKASIADNGCAFFIGLAFDHGSSVSIANAAEGLVDNTGALGAFSFLGFHVDNGDGDALNFVYKSEGQSQKDAIAGVQTLAADTFYKVGFVYDPAAANARKIQVFVDGTANSTYITQDDIDNIIFPDAEPLGLCLATKVGAASEVLVTADWWRVAQLR